MSERYNTAANEAEANLLQDNLFLMALYSSICLLALTFELETKRICPWNFYFFFLKEIGSFWVFFN